MTLAIAVEPADTPDVSALVGALNAEILSVYPPEACHHLSIEEMMGADVTVFVARENGLALGIGALRRLPDGAGEVKRMYTAPEARGRGVAQLILDAVTARAQAEGLPWLRLESGDKLAAAIALYARNGFHRCEAFGGYPSVCTSYFMEKRLISASPEPQHVEGA